MQLKLIEFATGLKVEHASLSPMPWRCTRKTHGFPYSHSPWSARSLFFPALVDLFQAHDIPELPNQQMDIHILNFPPPKAFYYRKAYDTTLEWGRREPPQMQIGAREISCCFLAPFKVWLTMCSEKGKQNLLRGHSTAVSQTVICDFFKNMYAKLTEQDQSRHCLVYMHVVNYNHCNF